MRDSIGTHDRVELASGFDGAPGHTRLFESDACACGNGRVSSNGNGGCGGDGRRAGHNADEDDSRGDAKFDNEEEDDGEADSDDEEDSDYRKYSLGFVEGDRASVQVDAGFGTQLMHHTQVVLGILLVGLNAEDVTLYAKSNTDLYMYTVKGLKTGWMA